MTISEKGFGYKDLDELAAKPQKLEFIIGKITTCVVIIYLLYILCIISSMILIRCRITNC